MMALHKAIKSGKEKRKEWRDSRRFDLWCRNHGRCAWCEGNRTVQAKRLRLAEQAEKSAI